MIYLITSTRAKQEQKFQEGKYLWVKGENLATECAQDDYVNQADSGRVVFFAFCIFSLGNCQDFFDSP